MAPRTEMTLTETRFSSKARKLGWLAQGGEAEAGPAVGELRPVSEDAPGGARRAAATAWPRLFGVASPIFTFTG